MGERAPGAGVRGRESWRAGGAGVRGGEAGARGGVRDAGSCRPGAGARDAGKLAPGAGARAPGSWRPGREVVREGPGVRHPFVSFSTEACGSRAGPVRGATAPGRSGICVVGNLRYTQVSNHARSRPCGRGAPGVTPRRKAHRSVTSCAFRVLLHASVRVPCHLPVPGTDPLSFGSPQGYQRTEGCGSGPRRPTGGARRRDPVRHPCASPASVPLSRRRVPRSCT